MHNAYYIPFTQYNQLYNGSDNRLYRAYAASAVSLHCSPTKAQTRARPTYNLKLRWSLCRRHNRPTKDAYSMLWWRPNEHRFSNTEQVCRPMANPVPKSSGFCIFEQITRNAGQQHHTTLTGPDKHRTHTDTHALAARSLLSQPRCSSHRRL